MPAAHGVQLAVVVSRIMPAGHTHAESALAEDGEILPAGQLVHSVDPVASAYVPARQALHTPCPPAERNQMFVLV